MGGIVRGDMMDSTDVFVPAGALSEDERKAEEAKREQAAKKAEEDSKSSDKV